MVQLAIHEVLRFFVILTSMFMVVYFICQSRYKIVSWRVIYVVGVEVLTYSISWVFDSLDSQPTLGSTEVPLIRYCSWIISCPVLIQIMLNIVAPHPTEEEADMNGKCMAADLIMIVAGMLAVTFDDIRSKMTLFMLSSACAMYVIRIMYTLYLTHKHELPDLEGRQRLMMIMLFSWSLFPLFFILGTECTGVISSETSISLHAVGDLFAKNFFSFMTAHVKSVAPVAKPVKPQMPIQDEDGRSFSTTSAPMHPNILTRRSSVSLRSHDLYLPYDSSSSPSDTSASPQLPLFPKPKIKHQRLKPSMSQGSLLGRRKSPVDQDFNAEMLRRHRTAQARRTQSRNTGSNGEPHSIEPNGEVINAEHDPGTFGTVQRGTPQSEQVLPSHRISPPQPQEVHRPSFLPSLTNHEKKLQRSQQSQTTTRSQNMYKERLIGHSTQNNPVIVEHSTPSVKLQTNSRAQNDVPQYILHSPHEPAAMTPGQEHWQLQLMNNPYGRGPPTGLHNQQRTVQQ